MNFVLSIALVSSLLLFTRQCGKESLLKGTPDCVLKKINEITSGAVWNPPAQIYSYFYNGEKVYFIPQHCCDFPSELYNEDCNLICSPDGGFSGNGDGRCKDFFTNRKDEKLIWEDERK